MLRLDDLLYGSAVSTTEFYAKHWERSPLHVSQRDGDFAATAARRARIFTLSDLESVLLSEEDGADTGTQRGDRGDVAATHSLLLQNGMRVGGAFSVAYLAGASIVTNRADLSAPRLAQICLELGCDLAYVFAVSYLTPPAGAQAVPPHSDDQDVFVVQTHGRKQWRVWPPIVALPYSDEMVGKRGAAPLNADDELGAPLLSVELQPGDVLYIPRGFVHDAFSVGDAPSLHVTLTVPTHDLTRGRALANAVERALRLDPRARHALPLARVARSRGRVTSTEVLGDKSEGGGESSSSADKALAEELKAILTDALARVFSGSGGEAAGAMLAATSERLFGPRAAQEAVAARGRSHAAGDDDGEVDRAIHRDAVSGSRARLRVVRGMRIELGSVEASSVAAGASGVGASAGAAAAAAAAPTAAMVVRRGDSSLHMRVGESDLPMLAAVAEHVHGRSGSGGGGDDGDGTFSVDDLPGRDSFAKMCIVHMLLDKGVLERSRVEAV